MRASLTMARKLTASFSNRVASRRRSFSQPMQPLHHVAPPVRSPCRSPPPPSGPCAGAAITALISPPPEVAADPAVAVPLVPGQPPRPPPRSARPAAARDPAHHRLERVDSCRCPASPPPPSAGPRRRRPGASWCRTRPASGPGRGRPARRGVPSVVCPAPAAALWARTTEPSMQNRSQSILPPASSRACRCVEQPAPGAVLAPAVEAARRRSARGRKGSRQVAPGGAGVEDPEDAVDHEAVVLGRPGPGPWRAGQEGAKDLPLRIGQAVSRSLHRS